MKLKMRRIDNKFIYFILPKLIYNHAVEITSYKSSSKMNKYLIKHYNRTLEDIVQEICHNLAITTLLDTVFIDVSSTKVLKNTNLPLKSLSNLIDYGNLEVQGIHLFQLTFNFIKTNIKLIYNKYKLKEVKS